MKSDKLVSILISIYNDEKYISDCLNSVLSQSYKNIEVILFDRSPNDKCKKIIESFDDNRIIFLQGDITAQQSLIDMYKHSKGEYLRMFCADDIMLEDSIKLQAEHLNSSNTDIVFSNMHTMSENGKFNKKDLLFSNAQKDNSSLLKYIFMERNPLLFPTAMLRKKIIYDDFFDIRYRQLYDLMKWTKLLLNNRTFFVIEKPLVAYRLRKGNGNLSNVFNFESQSRYVFEYMQLIKYVGNNISFAFLEKMFPEVVSLFTSKVPDDVNKYIPIVLSMLLLKKKEMFVFNYPIHKKYAIQAIFEGMGNEKDRKWIETNLKYSISELEKLMGSYFTNKELWTLSKSVKMFKYYLKNNGWIFTLQKTFRYVFR
ncbi:MAG: glycosyltransferase family 2 protein [Legionellales bacterium]|nr:glycosyltransferase family 2 protein [Legionellales bacterium]